MGTFDARAGTILVRGCSPPGCGYGLVTQDFWHRVMPTRHQLVSVHARHALAEDSAWLTLGLPRVPLFFTRVPLSGGIRWRPLLFTRI
jgi:hypothetical protein